MTDQPIEPRERDDDPDPAVTTPQPDPEPAKEGDDTKARNEALDGSGVGSDTRAGSLAGGSATGSERDPAQVASDRYLADLGPGLRAAEQPTEAPKAQPNPGVTNTGAPKEQAKAPGDQADPATS